MLARVLASFYIPYLGRGMAVLGQVVVSAAPEASIFFLPFLLLHWGSTQVWLMSWRYDCCSRRSGGGMASRWYGWARGIVCLSTGLVAAVSCADSCCCVFETAVYCLVLSSHIPNPFNSVAPTAGLFADVDDAVFEGGSYIVGDGGLEEGGAYLCVPFQAEDFIGVLVDCTGVTEGQYFLLCLLLRRLS